MRIVTENHPFNCRLISSCTPDALLLLSASLESGDIAAAAACCRRLDENLGIREGADPSVWTDYPSEPPLQIRLPSRAAPQLGARLCRLATEPEFSEVRLSEIIPNLEATSKNDWSFRLVHEYEEPPKEYQPFGEGAMWDAIVFHALPKVQDYAEAWRAVMEWSLEDPQYSDDLDLRRTEGEFDGQIPSAKAFSLLQRDSAANQAIGFRHTPFRRWFGDSHDWIQVWFEKDRTQLIVHDRAAATGNCGWDLENFFLYRHLVVALAKALSGDRIMWDIEADSLPAPQAIEPEHLEDSRILWSAFSRLPERPLTREHFEQECISFGNLQLTSFARS